MCQTRERQTQGLILAFSLGNFSGSSHISDFIIGTPVASRPGVVGWVLGPVSPVSVFCDLVR